MKPLNLIDKAFLLKKTSLFRSLDLDLLLTISDKMEMGFFKRGSKIFQLNQEAHRFYLIVEGIVLIKDASNNTLAELGSVEFFGDESLFNDKPRSYEALCHTDVSVLALSRSHLFSILAECPTVAISFLEAYAAAIDFRNR